MKSFLPFLLIVSVLMASQSEICSQSSPMHPATDSLKTIAIKVNGITCANDLKTIASQVEKLSGVFHCKPGKPGATSTFEVKYNPALTTEKQLFQAIEATEGCSDPNARPYKVKQQ